MALFKIFKGLKANLPLSYKDGYCYFTTDDGKMYIDTIDNNPSGRIGVNADKADKLTTPRKINNTLFDGSEDIITEKWGNARDIKIGNTAKSIDGSQNVTWTHKEIGAEISHNITNGTTTGPVLETTVNGVKSNATIIPSASSSISGVITTGSQTIAGIKTLTSNWHFKTTNYTSTPLGVYDDGTDYGHTIVLGGGGCTYIGGGESPSSLFNALGHDGENLILSADGSIKFYTNCDAVSNRKGFILNTNGYFYPETNGTGYIGTSTNKFSGMYANNFYGSDAFYSRKGLYWGKNDGLCLLIPGATEFKFTDNTNDDEAFRKEAIKKLCANNLNLSPSVFGRYHANSHGILLGDIYSTSNVDSTTGLPQYSTFLSLKLNSSIRIFGTSSYNYYERTVLDSENYQDYLDSKYVNITGDTMTGRLALNEWLQFNSATSGLYFPNATGGNACYIQPNNITSYGGLACYGSKGDYHGMAFGNEANALNIMNSATYKGLYCATGGWILCYNNDTKNIGVNTHSPQYKLHVNGTVYGTKVYGAVWNDYAEYRSCKEEFKSGQVVYENGDDTISISTKRLQRGCSIVSDTFGFIIGKTDEAKCPIAVSGRVLAYGYEPRDEFKKHIGYPVCSGPNGTVSIMTDEEEEKYPSRIIGIISAVPDYEEWGSGNIKVDNRIWIKVK